MSIKVRPRFETSGDSKASRHSHAAGGPERRGNGMFHMLYCRMGVSLVAAARCGDSLLNTRGAVLFSPGPLLPTSYVHLRRSVLASYLPGTIADELLGSYSITSFGSVGLCWRRTSTSLDILLEYTVPVTRDREHKLLLLIRHGSVGTPSSPRRIQTERIDPELPSYCRWHPYLNTLRMATFLEIHSPQAPTQCVPTTFSWDGGDAPYKLEITTVSGDQIGDVLQTYTGISGQSFQWAVNLPGGTSFGIVLSDSTPITVQFEPVVVQNGTDASCLGTASTGSSSVGSQTSTASSSTTASGTTTSTTSQTSDPNSTPPASTSNVSSVSSTTTSGASSTTRATSVNTSSSGKSLSSGAIAGIAIGAAFGGILIAVLAYLLYKRGRAARARRSRTLDLNESSLPPVQPPPTSKANEMRQHLLSPPHSALSSPMSSPGPSSVQFAHSQSHYTSASAVGTVANEHFPPTPRSRRRPLTTESGASSRAAKASEMVPSRVTSWATTESEAQESDAGVRLAGGPPTPILEIAESGGLGEGVSGPIPPPYRRYED